MTTFRVKGISNTNNFTIEQKDIVSLFDWLKETKQVPLGSTIQVFKSANSYAVIKSPDGVDLYHISQPQDKMVTEILTLEQLLPRNSADIQLAKFLNDGWSILCISHHVIHLGNGEADTRMRIVTLKREITD